MHSILQSTDGRTDGLTMVVTLRDEWQLRNAREEQACEMTRRPPTQHVDVTLHTAIALRSGPSGSDLGYSIEHLHPRSLGGGDGLDNLGLSHWGCNRNRKTQPLVTLWNA